MDGLAATVRRAGSVEELAGAMREVGNDSGAGGACADDTLSGWAS